ncbi:hypothetical protein Hdeb2414_s0438g00893801 [Helianthus debilis subsp. tardiflorus]
MICFDLDNTTVELVDNMHDSFAYYKMTSGKGTGKGTSFRSLGSPSKVKHYIVEYLKDVGHPTATRMVNADVTRKRLGWETTDNFNDCGVFTMRHMEVYKGSDVSFECGFSTNKAIQKMQLKNLRMKIATELLLSDANVYKGIVMGLAKETIHGMKDERVLKMLN